MSFAKSKFIGWQDAQKLDHMSAWLRFDEIRVEVGPVSADYSGGIKPVLSVVYVNSTKTSKVSEVKVFKYIREGSAGRAYYLTGNGQIDILCQNEKNAQDLVAIFASVSGIAHTKREVNHIGLVVQFGNKSVGAILDALNRFEKIAPLSIFLGMKESCGIDAGEAAAEYIKEVEGLYGAGKFDEALALALQGYDEGDLPDLITKLAELCQQTKDYKNLLLVLKHIKEKEEVFSFTEGLVNSEEFLTSMPDKPERIRYELELLDLCATARGAHPKRIALFTELSGRSLDQLVDFYGMPPDVNAASLVYFARINAGKSLDAAVRSGGMSAAPALASGGTYATAGALFAYASARGGSGVSVTDAVRRASVGASAEAAHGAGDTVVEPSA